jgi:hypothetical protein
LNLSRQTKEFNINMVSTGVQIPAEDVNAGSLRRASVSAIELKDEHGRRKTVHLEDMSEADRELAEKFGYNPVFKREFGYLATFSFAVSISGLFATVTTTFIYPLEAGGAR